MPTLEAGLTRIVGPASALLDVAARAIIARHEESVPNLTGIRVLLPSLHAANPFLRALHTSAGVQSLLAPQIETLASFAQRVPYAGAIASAASRHAQVYDALQRERWFQGLDLWRVSKEIVDLVDEFSRHRVALPADAAQLTAVLERAFDGRGGAPLQFEARVVYELWRALRSDAAVLDDVAVYHRQLTELAAQASHPLYAIGLDDLTVAEQEFLLRYAERQPVVCIDSVRIQDSGGVAFDAVLACAWRAFDGANKPPSTTLLERAKEFSARFPEDPLANRIRVFPAAGLEEEASAVAMQVRLWLSEGLRDIAIVALDRMAARRARALLERNHILIADESGWTLSTTAASSVIMRWLDVVTGQCYFRDLLDFIKSPFLFGTMARAVRSVAIFALQRKVRKANFIQGWTRLAALVETDAGAAEQELVGRLQQANTRLTRRRQTTLTEWLASLRESMDLLGALNSLQEDAAGTQLLTLLDTLKATVAQARTSYTLAQWRHWLAMQLEENNFRDTSIQSSVVLTTLAAAQLRAFDAAIVIGADNRRLPNKGSPGLFSKAARHELCLPGREYHQRIERERLTRLLSASKQVLFSWQASVDGEPQAESPYLAAMQAFSRIAYGKDLRHYRLRAAVLTREDATLTDAAEFVTAAPAPSAPNLLPDTITASSYGSLLACPYQFFARHVLRLGELDEVEETVDKRGYGELIHRVLKTFHERCPAVLEGSRDAVRSVLLEVTEQTFASALALNLEASAWKSRWDQKIDSYLDWQERRERDGWRWCAGEVWWEQPLARRRLLGRVDRIDRRGNELAVLDYKTQRRQSVQQRVASPGEDVQLPFYAMLAEQPVTDGVYVALDDEKISSLPPKAAMDELMTLNRARLGSLMQALESGDKMPANGAERACEYCEMRGLCRRQHWHPPQEP